MTKYRGNPWAILLVLSLGFFMTLLDLTIVNIAIPNMITKLHASLDDILWVFNAYALVLAVLLITAGRLGDLLGQQLHVHHPRIVWLFDQQPDYAVNCPDSKHLQRRVTP